jgi:ribosomal protein L37E
MALINCPECGRTVSDFANACPNCGYPVSMMKKQWANNAQKRYGTDKQPPVDMYEEEPDYIADCFDGDYQLFEDNYSD